MQVVMLCVALCILLLTVSVASAADRPSYTLYKAGTDIVIDGRLDEPAWVGAPDVGAFVFPWYEGGKKEQTVAKMLWDDEYLYAGG